MKNFLIISCLLLSGFVAGAQTRTVTVTNPASVERKDELIVLKKDWLAKKLGKLSPGQFVTVSLKGVPQVVQYDDLNGDGQWDEAVLLQDFNPREKVVFSIARSNAPATVNAVTRAYVRQKHKMADDSFGSLITEDVMPFNNPNTDFSKQKLPPYLTEGPAWENDKVGFRKYFDIRNTNDIWGKRTPEMVLDHVGTNPANIYHHLSDWGMDILKVGNSLGAGALAMQLYLNGKDTVIRFGRDVKKLSYKQIANGPVRAVFEMRYEGWQYTPSVAPIDVTEQISIWGGQYFFENKVTMKQVPAGAKLVTGTIDFFSEKDYKLSKGGVAGIYTYDKQSENKDMLGLGVLTAQKNIAGYAHLPASGTGVTNTFAVMLIPKAAKPLVYRYYAAWELTDKQFSSKQGFEKFIDNEAIKLGNPLVLK
ncbi:MAG: DUF4861 domain-containing protein [Niabella sp.]